MASNGAACEATLLETPDDAYDGLWRGVHSYLPEGSICQQLIRRLMA